MKRGLESLLRLHLSQTRLTKIGLLITAFLVNGFNLEINLKNQQVYIIMIIPFVLVCSLRQPFCSAAESQNELSNHDERDGCTCA